MNKAIKRMTAAAFVVLASAALLAAPAQAQSDQQKLVNEASTTLSNFLRDPDMSWLQGNIGRARAVLIAPRSPRPDSSSAVRADAPSCSRVTRRRANGPARRSTRWRRRASASRPAFRFPRT